MRTLTDITGLTCGAETSIRDAVKALNDNPYLFQVVVGADNEVLGTLTDGDVRRGLLHDLSLDQSVVHAMNSTPVLGEEGAAPISPERLRELAGFLPIVDSQKRLRGILVHGSGVPLVTTALIMAGGRGARLGELTQRVPKPLVEVAGQPILEHILQKLESAHVERIYIAVYYLGEKISEFVRSRENRSEVEIMHEPEPLGTAGALSMLSESCESPLLVLNGDLLTSVDLAAFADFHWQNGFDATIGASEYKIELPYGVIRYGQDGLFRNIDEKPVLRQYVSSGIYLLSSNCRKMVPRATAMDMPALLNAANHQGLDIGVFPIHEYWQDVGRRMDLEDADRLYRENNGA